MQQVSLESLPRSDRQTVEEVKQFFKWAGPPSTPRPTRFVAIQWLEGLLTIAEGRRIETDQELARFLTR